MKTKIFKTGLSIAVLTSLSVQAQTAIGDGANASGGNVAIVYGLTAIISVIFVVGIIINNN